MSKNTILTEQDGAAYVITLNIPKKRNAFSIEMMREIAEAALEAEGDPSVRAIIITGGKQFFLSLIHI